MRYIVDTERFTIEPADEAKPAPPPSSSSRAPSATASWFDDAPFALLSKWWLQASWQRRYSYQFKWMGRPIIQLPQDVMLMQELIWRHRPTLIIETGIAHGGSAIFHASMLDLIHARCRDSPAKPRQSEATPRVLAIDIDIRPHNREAIEAHPLAGLITLVDGSSIDAKVITIAAALAETHPRVMVVLDSNHSRDHVLAELQVYAPMVTPASAIVVMDGVMPLLAELPGGDASWRDDHPAAAVEQFLASPQGAAFAIDRSFDGYALTHSPRGVLVKEAVQ